MSNNADTANSTADAIKVSIVTAPGFEPDKADTLLISEALRFACTLMQMHGILEISNTGQGVRLVEDSASIPKVCRRNILDIVNALNSYLRAIKVVGIRISESNAMRSPWEQLMQVEAEVENAVEVTRYAEEVVDNVEMVDTDTKNDEVN